MAIEKNNTQIGRVVQVTKDLITINIMAKAKNVELVFQSDKPYLNYKIGRETKSHSLFFQNMPILKGSKVLGTFDNFHYDAPALASLFNVEEKDANAKMHQEVLELVKKAGMLFTNPNPKPTGRKIDKESAEYKLWKNTEDSLWQLACVIQLYDPIAAAQEQKANSNRTEKEGSENQPEEPAIEGEQTLEMEIEQAAVFTATTLFDKGSPEFGLKGVSESMKMLREKKIQHADFRINTINLLKVAYIESVNDFEANLAGTVVDQLRPVAEFLYKLKARTEANLENAQVSMGLDEETIQYFKDEIASLTKFLEGISEIINEQDELLKEEEDVEEQAEQPTT